MGNLTFRLMQEGEEEEIFSLIERGFNAFVRNDFLQEGVDEFQRAIRDMIFNHPPGHFIMVAEAHEGIVGMIDVRDNCHISIFFIEPSQMNRGIGRTLLDHAIALCLRKEPELSEIEVHSSPWAVPVYKRLGFDATGPEQEECGIRYTRMVKKLSA